MQTKNYKHIIWDWNGTLLDDVEIVVDGMNDLLQSQGLPCIDIARHKEIFTFPIKEYYIQLGFDLTRTPFEELSDRFVFKFNSKQHEWKLHYKAEEVLSSIKAAGVGQSILSASEEQILQEAVEAMGISKYFAKIAGIGDRYAASKIERGRKLLLELELNPKDVLVVGDTTHDYEVAKELGCDSLLICNGHQSREKLSGYHKNIVSTIAEVKV